jgi:hypothetical protein
MRLKINRKAYRSLLTLLTYIPVGEGVEAQSCTNIFFKLSALVVAVK